MEKNIIQLDLDDTLQKTSAMQCIIDKNNPNKTLLRIKGIDGNLLLSGFYKKDNLPFDYNGIEGQLSKELFEKIQNKKKINIKDIGLSFREYSEYEYISNQAKDLIVYIDRFKFLKDSNDIINLITARGNKENHLSLLNTLEDKLKTINIKINDSYFISDPKLKLYGSIPERKLILVLQNIVGFELKDHVFQPIELDSYLTSFIFDDEDKNCDMFKDINFYLQKYLSNTQPFLREKIEKKLKLEKHVLKIHKINSNELNPFIITDIEIKIND